MKLLLPALLLVATLAAKPVAPPAPADAAAVKGPVPYPLATCIVSGEHLEAGQIVSITYSEPGKPDRIIKLCCRKCLAKFKGDPAKYLEAIDAAAARKPNKD